MKITKYGHCCMLIEEGGLRIITDPAPAPFSTGQDAARNVDMILITHEHGDHFHVDAVKAILAGNPQAKVVTNHAVGALLQAANIPFEVLDDTQSRTDKGITIDGIGTEHAVIYPTVPGVLNTGYFIANKLFFPGDAFTLPERPVDILALPVAAPWLKLSEVIDYAKAVKPKIWFPVHDAVARDINFAYMMPSRFLEGMNLPGKMLELGQEVEF